MKTDKEYPATHSMSTTWYAVDAEGNVALMDYNENGPVPHGLEENYIPELILQLPANDTCFPRLFMVKSYKSLKISSLTF